MLTRKICVELLVGAGELELSPEIDEPSYVEFEFEVEVDVELVDDSFDHALGTEKCSHVEVEIVDFNQIGKDTSTGELVSFSPEIKAFLEEQIDADDFVGLAEDGPNDDHAYEDARDRAEYFEDR